MKLFEPIAVNGMELKNRIVMPPMQLTLGLSNRRAMAYYLERAKGGAGAVIMAATSVDLFLDDRAWGRAGAVSKFIERMQHFTAQVNETGARIGVQLWHGNELPAGSGIPGQPGVELAAPSAVDGMRELTPEEIRSISAKFARASGRARTAGFDFIELHGAHGYLLCQFFSGADNQRTDAYGGDSRKRMRFGLETVRAVRASVGDDYPIFYRLGAEEDRPGGITLEQSRAFAAELQTAGVDVMDVSIGRNKVQIGAPSKRAAMGTYVPLAEAIKGSVTVPVIGVGRINTPEVAEAILTQQRADLVAIGRQLIADPHWPNKVREGRFETVLPCESCNTCYVPLRSGKWVPGGRICKVNERAGREIDTPQPEPSSGGPKAL